LQLADIDQMTISYKNIHFDQYLALLKSIYPTINGLVVFDRHANLVWQDARNRVDEEQLLSLIPKFMRSESNSLIQNLLNGELGELVKLRDRHDVPALLLCLCRSPEGKATMPTLAIEPAFEQLSEMLISDYLQNLELASKENELILMTDELTRRYEELNLIYKAEDQAINTFHGRELLRQLVLNTSRFLNVDIIYLYIAGKGISMHKYRNDNPVFHADALFTCMRDTIHPILEADARPVVVNHVEEQHKLGIEQDLPFKFVVSPVVNTDGKAIGLLATASQDFAVDDFSNSDRNLLDVMAKKASKISQSHFDPLTGLENSHSFELILKDLLRQSRERGVSHAIANIDIDRLAVVNDISGREAGDELIKRIARKLSDTVRSHDLVARLGSDKFGVLIKNCDLLTAEVIMKKVSHAVSSMDMEWEGKRHEVSISIGVAPISSQTQSVTSLLDAAETARNVSKQRGRNNIHVLEMEDSNLLRRKEQISWVGRIQDALRDDRFRLYAQLIEPMKPGARQQHYEILLRLEDEEGKIVNPGEFLTAAESFYLMASLDLWVINQAFSELTEMHRGPCKFHCQLSINLSGQSLNDPHALASYIENKLEEYELDGHDICFEITESAAIENLDEAAVFIEQIRELGCKFSLDDFGTGLSSFSYLKTLNVDYLKIDGSFVRDILIDPVSESMVAAINQVGQAMDLETIAEYVESDDIKRKLASIGVDYGQGYSIGRPALFTQIQADLAKSA
jgi:diguanylate cyclase (GGDEF)-like protein